MFTSSWIACLTVAGLQLPCWARQITRPGIFLLNPPVISHEAVSFRWPIRNGVSMDRKWLSLVYTIIIYMVPPQKKEQTDIFSDYSTFGVNYSTLLHCEQGGTIYIYIYTHYIEILYFMQFSQKPCNRPTLQTLQSFLDWRLKIEDLRRTSSIPDWRLKIEDLKKTLSQNPHYAICKC